MAKKQLLVLWITIGLLSLVCLFIPWRYHHFDSRTGVDTFVTGPYRLFFSGPPEVPLVEKDNPGWTYDSKRERYADFDFKGYPFREWKVEIDKLRIVIPGVVILVLGSGLLITLHKGKSLAA